MRFARAFYGQFQDGAAPSATVRLLATCGHEFDAWRHSDAIDPRASVRTKNQMKAIVQNGYGSPDALQLREIDPPAVADDAILVRIRAASINALDWYLLRRLAHVFARLFGKPLPRIRGADMAGI